MSTDLVVADIGEGHDSCLNRMQQARVRHLLVLEKSRLAGIVSFRDLLAVDLEEKNEEITLLNAYIHYIPANLQIATKP
jgi:CBS domain-containing protein